MSSFFPSYSNSTVYNVSKKQEFDKYLSNFLNGSELYGDLNKEFLEIENYLTYQPVDFFEETFLTTCSKILYYLSSNRFQETTISAVQTFILMLKKDKFKDVFPKLENYGTNETFELISFLLTNNNIILAENITNTFVHPEKRTLKAFYTNTNHNNTTNNNIIEWCLKNTKIAALKFLIHNYDGFNTKTIQELFLRYAELGEEYISKVFPDNIYPTILEDSFEKFFNNPSTVLLKKLQLVSYFSKKTDFIPKELVSFIYNGLSENVISIDSLKNNDFYEKLTSEKTLSNFLPYSKANFIYFLKTYLSFFENKENIAQISFDLLSKNVKKENFNTILTDFIKEFPEFSKEKFEDIKKYIISSNTAMSFSFFSLLKSSLVLDEELNNYLISKNEELYFYIKNPTNDSEYINKCVKFIIDNGIFPDFPDSTCIQPVFNKLSQKLDNDKLANLFFINSSFYDNFKILKKINVTLVLDLPSLSIENKEKLIKNLTHVLDSKITYELKPKKWYQLSSEKPLQLVLKNGEISLITKPEDKIFITSEIEDTLNSSSVSIILAQAKKDLSKFRQITSEPLDFNLEFKIRSESIFMQQMNFLTQIQKIESELKIDDLYFLKNNLGKYLIQCTETYSRALSRQQTLLENPGLFKKQDTTLDSQKEKIDGEALKQVTLLEKELNFVKENVINTLNSDSFSDMRINTRFLEAKVEHEEDISIIKLVVNKPK